MPCFSHGGFLLPPSPGYCSSLCPAPKHFREISFYCLGIDILPFSYWLFYIPPLVLLLPDGLDILSFKRKVWRIGFLFYLLRDTVPDLSVLPSGPLFTHLIPVLGVRCLRVPFEYFEPCLLGGPVGFCLQCRSVCSVAHPSVCIYLDIRWPKSLSCKERSRKKDFWLVKSFNTGHRSLPSVLWGIGGGEPVIHCGSVVIWVLWISEGGGWASQHFSMANTAVNSIGRQPLRVVLAAVKETLQGYFLAEAATFT